MTLVIYAFLPHSVMSVLGICDVDTFSIGRHMPDWLAYANFALNLLILPLLKVLWDIKIELTRLDTQFDNYLKRLERLERHQDSQQVTELRT